MTGRDDSPRQIHLTHFLIFFLTNHIYMNKSSRSLLIWYSAWLVWQWFLIGNMNTNC